MRTAIQKRPIMWMANQRRFTISHIADGGAGAMYTVNAHTMSIAHAQNAMHLSESRCRREYRLFAVRWCTSWSSCTLDNWSPFVSVFMRTTDQQRKKQLQQKFCQYSNIFPASNYLLLSSSLSLRHGNHTMWFRNRSKLPFLGTDAIFFFGGNSINFRPPIARSFSHSHPHLRVTFTLQQWNAYDHFEMDLKCSSTKPNWWYS